MKLIWLLRAMYELHARWLHEHTSCVCDFEMDSIVKILVHEEQDLVMFKLTFGYGLEEIDARKIYPGTFD